jgi:hypothetical protein
MLPSAFKGRVRVVGARGTAKIRAILSSVHGALLERQIDGFRNWNLDGLLCGICGKRLGEFCYFIGVPT